LSAEYRPLNECSFTFSRVRETIKAAANKPRVISSTNAGFVGGDLVVTHEGETGTIGAGSASDFDMVWLSPAARSNWPSEALRLFKVEVQYFSNKNLVGGSSSSVIQDALILKPARSNLGFVPKGYRAKYFYRIVGSAPNTSIAPVAQISSGTQIKHTDMGAYSGLSGTSLTLSNISVNATVTKEALANTGFDSWWLALWAALLVTLGTMTVVTNRRKS